MLSYIHVDGDFNPRRVMAARVHGGLHPRRVHEEATLSIPPWPSPTKDLPHLGRSSRSRRSPCPYKLLGSTPHHNGGSQATPNQSRRHHSPKGNRCCCWWWTPCSCASNDNLPNTQLSLTDLAMVERWFEWKATWGRLEIKFFVVGMECLDLNTWVGGSLSENG